MEQIPNTAMSHDFGYVLLVVSTETYSLYAKNIKPGLTPENQLKQVAFSRRVQ